MKTLPVHGEEKRLWRFANRLNPGYQTEGDDHFVSGSQVWGKERHINCVVTSLAFERSMRGTPTTATAHNGWAHVTPAAVAATKARLGPDFAERFTGNADESLLHLEDMPDVTFERADDYRALAARLTTSGPGSRMIFVARWDTPRDEHGGHAINMVNVRGQVVVVDAQSGVLMTPERYFTEVIPTAVWSKFRYHVTAEGASDKSVFAEADAERKRLLQLEPASSPPSSAPKTITLTPESRE